MAQWLCPYNILNGHGWSCKRENNGDRKIRPEPCVSPCHRLIDKPRKTFISKLEKGYCCIGTYRDWCGHVHDKPTTAYDCCINDIEYARDCLDMVSDRRVYDLKSLTLYDGEPKLRDASRPISSLEFAIEPKDRFLPFHRQMRDAVLNGKKCMTSRNKPYGRPGDRFLVENREYIIEWVMPFRLGFVACFLYGYEGFKSPKEFIDFWGVIARGHPFNPRKIVFTHKFFPSFADASQLR